MKKIFLLICLMAVAGFAELKTWDNSTADGLYATADNWTPSGVPANTDTLEFGSGSTSACDFGGARTCAKLRTSNSYDFGSTFNLVVTGAGDPALPISLDAGTTFSGGTLGYAPGSSYGTLSNLVGLTGMYTDNQTAVQRIIHIGSVTGSSYVNFFPFAPNNDTLFFDGDSIVNGGNFTYGASGWGGNGISNAYYNSTIVRIAGNMIPGDANPANGIYRHNMGTSQWYVGGNYRYATNGGYTLSVGTSSVTLTSTGDIITGNENPAFYDLTISGGTRTATDSILCSGDVTVSGGTLKVIGKTVRCVDYTIASGATINDTTSKIYVSGNIAFGNTATRLKGTGKYILSSGVTHTFASGTGNQKFDTISVLGSTTFSGVDTMKLQMAVGVLAMGGTHVFSAGYDIEGSSGNLDSLTSMDIDIPANDSIDYVYLYNVNLATSDTLWMGVNSVNGGGNSGNIIFPVTDTVPIISGIDDSLVYFGDTVTVSGSIFGAAPTLYVDGGVVPTISVSATEIVFRTTDLSQGLKQLVVKNNTYNTYDTSTLYYNQIVIDSIRPERGTVGDTLSVYGVFVASEPSVKIGDSVIGTFVARTDSMCSFRAVPGYVGQVAVIVYRGGLGYADTIRFDYDTIPVLASASPMFSKLAPQAGYLDTIIGTGMDQIDTVFYGDSVMVAPKSRSYTMWIDTINGYHVRGWQDFISVSQYGYRDTLIGAINFKNLHITSLTPSSGKIGDTITMRAIWGFKTSGLAVKIDTATATVIAGYNDTLARIIAPVNPRGYNKSVEVVNSDNDTTYSAWSYPFDNQGGGRGSSTSGRGLIISAE